jgi:hypothetical protein
MSYHDESHDVLSRIPKKTAFPAASLNWLSEIKRIDASNPIFPVQDSQRLFSEDKLRVQLCKLPNDVTTRFPAGGGGGGDVKLPILGKLQHHL